MKKIKAFNKWPLWTLAGGVLVTFFYVVFQAAYFVDFPVVDDFRILFGMGQKAVEQGWGSLSTANLTEQHFSHRTIPVHAAAALQVLVLGQLDFCGLRMLGIGLQAGAFGLLCYGLARSGRWAVLSPLLLALLYFQPQLSGAFSLAIQGPMQLGAVAMVCAFLARAEIAGVRGWLGAWIFAGLALLGSVNGFLVAALLVLWDAWEKRYRNLLGSILMFMLLAALYFWDYQVATHEGTGHAFVAADVVPGALVMLGGVLTFGPLPLGFTMAAGAVLLLASLGVAWWALVNKRGFVLAIVLFLLGSVGMAAIGRAGWGLGYMLQWRYIVVSLMLLLVVVGVALPWLTGTRARTAATVAGVLVFAILGWWQYAPKVVYEKRESMATAMSWHLGAPAFYSASERGIAFRGNETQKAVEAGIFRVPYLAEAERLAATCRIPVAPEAIDLRYEVAVAGYVASIKHPVMADYILFQEPDGNVRVAARLTKRFAIGRFLRGEGQSSDAEFSLPRTRPGTEAPAGVFLVPEEIN